MKNYPDSVSGVKACLKEVLDSSYVFIPDIIEPDPHVSFVWIAIDTKNKKTMVIYLKDNDAEEIMYKTPNWRDYLL
jgi:hypothetical protein